jgi:hypothetical protein
LGAGAAKGEAGCAAFLLLSCLGFFFSLLLLCSLLAMSQSFPDRQAILTRESHQFSAPVCARRMPDAILRMLRIEKQNPAMGENKSPLRVVHGAFFGVTAG